MTEWDAWLNAKDRPPAEELLRLTLAAYRGEVIPSADLVEALFDLTCPGKDDTRIAVWDEANKKAVLQNHHLVTLRADTVRVLAALVQGIRQMKPGSAVRLRPGKPPSARRAAWLKEVRIITHVERLMGEGWPKEAAVEEASTKGEVSTRTVYEYLKKWGS